MDNPISHSSYTYTASEMLQIPRFRFKRLVLLVLLVEELPVSRLADDVSNTPIEFAHLMKSASSELEALIGGVAAAAAGFEGPERAYLTPPNMVANQAMASFDVLSV